MLRFKQYIAEAKEGKNLHLEHLEDEVLNNGINGTRGAINFLQSLRDMLAGNASSGVNITVKWEVLQQSLQEPIQRMESSLWELKEFSRWVVPRK